VANHWVEWKELEVTEAEVKRAMSRYIGASVVCVCGCGCLCACVHVCCVCVCVYGGHVRALCV
jgi:hypothetical protein